MGNNGFKVARYAFSILSHFFQYFSHILMNPYNGNVFMVTSIMNTGWSLQSYSQVLRIIAGEKVTDGHSATSRYFHNFSMDHLIRLLYPYLMWWGILPSAFVFSKKARRRMCRSWKIYFFMFSLFAKINLIKLPESLQGGRKFVGTFSFNVCWTMSRC